MVEGASPEDEAAKEVVPAAAVSEPPALSVPAAWFEPDGGAEEDLGATGSGLSWFDDEGDEFTLQEPLDLARELLDRPVSTEARGWLGASILRIDGGRLTHSRTVYAGGRWSTPGVICRVTGKQVILTLSDDIAGPVAELTGPGRRCLRLAAGESTVFTRGETSWRVDAIRTPRPPWVSRLGGGLAFGVLAVVSVLIHGGGLVPLGRLPSTGGQATVAPEDEGFASVTLERAQPVAAPKVTSQARVEGTLAREGAVEAMGQICSSATGGGGEKCVIQESLLSTQWHLVFREHPTHNWVLVGYSTGNYDSKDAARMAQVEESIDQFCNEIDRNLGPATSPAE